MPGTATTAHVLELLARPDAPRCSVARSLRVLGEKWTLLIVRDAFWGSTRFSEFRVSLGISSDILTDRLATLVDAGILEQRSYRDDGSRERSSYHLTDAGNDLTFVLAALNAWGDRVLPNPAGPATLYERRGSHEPVRLAFVDAAGHAVADDEVEAVRGPGFVGR